MEDDAWPKQDNWKLEYILPIFLIPHKNLVEKIQDNISTIEGEIDETGESFHGKVKDQENVKASLCDLYVFVNQDNNRVRFRSTLDETTDHSDNLVLKEYLYEGERNLTSTRLYEVPVNEENIKNDKIEIKGKIFPYQEDFPNRKEGVTATKPSKIPFKSDSKDTSYIWAEYDSINKVKDIIPDPNALIPLES